MDREAGRRSLPPELRPLDQPVKEGDTDILVGPKEDCYVPADQVNLVSQMRQTYHESDQDPLEQSLIRYDKDGSAYIDLIQPITVGVFSPDEAHVYLDNINRMWKARHKLEDLHQLSDGSYLIVIAGHRRVLGIRKVAREIGLPIERVKIVAHIDHGDEISFRDAVSKQYRENFHKRPESWEDALAVNAIYQDGFTEGDYKSFADCSKDLSISEDRISRAVRYSTLPETVQTLVEQGSLHFGRALLLTALFSAMAFKHLRENVPDDVRASFWSLLNNNKLNLQDVWKLVNTERKHQLSNDFVMHAARVASMSSQAKARAYCANVQADMFVHQFSLVEVGEEALHRHDERQGRAQARQVALEALRALVAVLYGDVDRAKRGQKLSVTRSPLIRGQVAAMTSALHELVHMRPDDPTTVLHLARVALTSLEREDDEADEIIEAMLEARHVTTEEATAPLF